MLRVQELFWRRVCSGDFKQAGSSAGAASELGFTADLLWLFATLAFIDTDCYEIMF